MNKKRMSLIFSGVLLWMMSAGAAPKNIIFLIGDGMGPAQVTAAKYTQGTLQMERFPVGGFATTYSENKMVTDSAAAGTALATGHKTSNGTLAQSPSGTPFKTALEVAEEKGKSTGLVVTCAITHATPASFCSHVKKRGMQPQIAEQIAAQEIEVLFGGGLGYFIPQAEEGSLRKDEKNVLATLKSKMPVITTQAEFDALGTPNRVAGFFAKNALPKVSEGRIELAAMTKKALEILAQNEKGFFLMVEGSQIDWAGHANDADYIISETLDFDKTVGVVLDFAAQHPDTLVVVTADHETGGFVLLNGSIPKHEISETSFGTKHHSATMVPIFAAGAGSKAFGGIHDNTEIGRQIIQYLSETSDSEKK